jgi:hypothetical protein
MDDTCIVDRGCDGYRSSRKTVQWAFLSLVLLFAPGLQLFPCAGERQEPVRVQALGPEAFVEGFNEPVVRRLAGREKSSVTSFAYAHRSKSREMNSEL